MAQVAFIASGQAQLDGAAGTVTVVNPGITANSIVLIGTGTALNEAGAGLHLVAIPQNGRVSFSSVDEGGNAVAGDVYSFNYVILEGGNINIDITATINAHKDALILDPVNVGLYVDNLNAMKTADAAIKENNATRAVVVGAAMAPGSQKLPLPYAVPEKPAPALTINSGEYTNVIFDSDAIGKNHNGQTRTNVPFPGGGAIARMTMTNFYDQITNGDAAGGGFVAGSLRDALSYYVKLTGDRTKPFAPILRYKMPTYHYRTDTGNPALDNPAHYVAINHLSLLPYFNIDGILVTDPTGAGGPNTNSFEAQSLQAAFDNLRRETITGAEGSKLIRKEVSKNVFAPKLTGWKYKQTPAIPAVNNVGGQVPIRILPNFLFGCSIRNAEPETDGNNLGRPLVSGSDPSVHDVWCKIFPQDTQPGQKAPGFVVPYDKNKFLIPNICYPVERWDGVLLYIHRTNNTFIDMPVGAVMIGEPAPLNNSDNGSRDWMTNFYPAIAATFARLFTDAGHLLEMFPAANREMYGGGSMMSHIMGLAMYVYNLRDIGRDLQDRVPAISGGYIKKNITSRKNRNMNKRQRQRRSKSKSMSMLKSAKRTFYRTNKRNKTSRQYH